ncbi:hypothetical protein VKT23_007772 [Stygiomarasmius scandens]|uniref:GTP cyclohydrolase N-terminal domain-containing protein n=1 Tax=Marasmiellus scandens TaxID=2682957 RepID=A0ABR1JPI7_9AGAR
MSSAVSPPPDIQNWLLQTREDALPRPCPILLTTYPDQHGIHPYQLSWFSSPSTRGPVICSRPPSFIKLPNATGARSSSYSIHRALSIGMGTLDPNHRPDYILTSPPFEAPPNEARLPKFSDEGGCSLKRQAGCIQC